MLIYLWDTRKFRLDFGNRLLTTRALEQRNGHSSKADRVQAVSEQCSQWYGLVLGSPAANRELDSMILMGACQLEIFYSFTLYIVEPNIS